jgi:hypothetical protein
VEGAELAPDRERSSASARRHVTGAAASFAPASLSHEGGGGSSYSGGGPFGILGLGQARSPTAQSATKTARERALTDEES